MYGRIYYKTIDDEQAFYLFSPMTVMLSINYRTQVDILKFISTMFYGGPERLVCYSEQPDVSIPSMNFYVAQGIEVCIFCMLIF